MICRLKDVRGRKSPGSSWVSKALDFRGLEVDGIRVQVNFRIWISVHVGIKITVVSD